MNGRKQPPTQAIFFAGEASEEKSRTVDYIKMFNFCGFSLWVFPMTANSLSDSSLVQNKLLS